jgi:amino acid transporter
MLAALLLAGIIAAPLTSLALFVPTRGPRRTRGAWATSRRFVLALIGTAVLAGIVAGALYLFGYTTRQSLVAAAALAAASLLWLPATRRWSARGHLCWAASVFLFAFYLAFVWNWTFVSHLGAASTAGGLVLWALELFAAVLACAYLWELCDALGTERWRRRVTRDLHTGMVADDLPFVSLHVPAYNEPPDMVIATLTSLLALDYPRFQIVAIDDNTDD